MSKKTLSYIQNWRLLCGVVEDNDDFVHLLMTAVKDPVIKLEDGSVYKIGDYFFVFNVNCQCLYVAASLEQAVQALFNIILDNYEPATQI